MNTSAIDCISDRGGLPLRPPLLPKRLSWIGMAQTVLSAYNVVRRAILRKKIEVSGPLLQEVNQRASRPSDIDEHLATLFLETVLSRPNLIVELGVRDGTSTFVFERAAAIFGATLISVDLEDCGSISSYDKWYFLRGDDVRIAGEFVDFCSARDLPGMIDVLFIDTSHYHEHTVEEIRVWFPLLAPRAKVLFHDTNSKHIGPRRDGCFQFGWDNHRGVVRAIEEFLQITIQEDREEIQHAGEWLVRHSPYCNGLTILDRID